MSQTSVASLGIDTWQKLEPPVLPDIPRMTTPAELRYLYWLTRERFSGAGQVVELGSWLGAGTVSLAAGLRDRGSTAKVTTIDRFEWAGDIYERKFASGLSLGDDFEPLLRANIAFIADYIDVVRADFASFVWTGGPIEILLVDAPKKREIVLAFLAAFGPHLIPGKSLVVFQDYLHGPSFSLPAILSAFDEFRVVDVVTPGTSVGMELTRPLDLDPERLAQCDPLKWSEAQTAEHWARVVAPLPEKSRARLTLSLPMLLMSQGRVEAAQAETRRIAHTFDVWQALNKLKDTYLAVMYRPIFEAGGFEVKPSTAAMHSWVSSQEMRAGRRAAAKAAAEEALRLDPDFKPAQKRLAQIAQQEAAAAARVLADAEKARLNAELAHKRKAAAAARALADAEKARLKAELARKRKAAAAARALADAEKARLKAERAVELARKRKAAAKAAKRARAPLPRRLVYRVKDWTRSLFGRGAD